MRARVAASILGILLTPTLATAKIAPSLPANCTTAHARYEMMGAPGFTAGFRPEPKRPGWLTDVAFFVRSDQSKKTFWFLFDVGTARYINLISTTDATAPDWAPPPPDGGARPLGEMHFMAADAALKFSLDLPRQSAAAPVYILLPDLSEKLRYGQKGLDQEEAPTAFFKLTGC